MQDKCYELHKGCGKCKHDECKDEVNESACCCECHNEKQCHGCGTNFKEAVCIHTEKIFDSCREQD